MMGASTGARSIPTILESISVTTPLIPGWCGCSPETNARTTIRDKVVRRGKPFSTAKNSGITMTGETPFLASIG